MRSASLPALTAASDGRITGGDRPCFYVTLRRAPVILRSRDRPATSRASCGSTLRRRMAGAGDAGSISAQVPSSARALSHGSGKLTHEVDKLQATVRAA